MDEDDCIERFLPEIASSVYILANCFPFGPHPGGWAARLQTPVVGSRRRGRVLRERDAGPGVLASHIQPTGGGGGWGGGGGGV